MSWLIYTALVAAVGLFAVGMVKAVPAVSGQAESTANSSQPAVGGSLRQARAVAPGGASTGDGAQLIAASKGTTRLLIPGSTSRAPWPSASQSVPSPPRPGSTQVSSPVTGPASGPTSTPTATSAPTPTSSAGGQGQTFVLAGGSSIQATCTGSTLSTSVTLASGWLIEESEKSSGHLHLHIRAAVGGAEAEVLVSCQNGSPVVA